jgi:hypothetical protein
VNEIERLRRWQLAIGDEDQAILSEQDARLSAACRRCITRLPETKCAAPWEHLFPISEFRPIRQNPMTPRLQLASHHWEC